MCIYDIITITEIFLSKEESLKIFDFQTRVLFHRLILIFKFRRSFVCILIKDQYYASIR